MEFDLSKIDDKELLKEIGRRFEEKSASIAEMEFMTKKLLELNEKTKEAEAIKGEFLSIIKNEFNNPLSTLLNFASILVKKPEKVQEIARLMHLELLRLDFHFKNIFAATEIEAGEIANYYSVIDFDSIFEDVKKQFIYIIEEKNLKLSYKNSINSQIVSDGKKLYLILLNLVSNACEFSFSNSDVNIEIKEDEDNFFIMVEDFGEGIYLDYQAKIFDRFQKFSSGRTRAHSGLGLGLSVCRGMAEALSGEISFESKEGLTKFNVKFPKKPQELEVIDSSSDANMLLFDDFSDVKEL